MSCVGLHTQRGTDASVSHKEARSFHRHCSTFSFFDIVIICILLLEILPRFSAHYSPIE